MARASPDARALAAAARTDPPDRAAPGRGFHGAAVAALAESRDGRGTPRASGLPRALPGAPASQAGARHRVGVEHAAEGACRSGARSASGPVRCVSKPGIARASPTPGRFHAPPRLGSERANGAEDHLATRIGENAHESLARVAIADAPGIVGPRSTHILVRVLQGSEEDPGERSHGDG